MLLNLNIEDEGVEWGNFQGTLTPMLVITRSARLADSGEGLYHDGLVLFDGEVSLNGTHVRAMQGLMAIATKQKDKVLGALPMKDRGQKPPGLTDRRWVVNKQTKYMLLPDNFDLDHFDTMMKVGMP